MEGMNYYPLLNYYPTMWPWAMILTSDFQGHLWNSCIPRMGGLIDMEQKGWESLGCWAPYVTFTFTFTLDLGLRFSRLNFQIIKYVRNGRVSWLGMKGMGDRYDVWPTMQPCGTCNMGLPWTTAHTKYIGHVMGWCRAVTKGKHPESGGASREITCWHQAEDSDAWCQQVISRLAPPNVRVFSFFTVLLCFFEEEEVKFLGQHFYYAIHYAVPRGGGSRSFLRDTLSSTV